MHCAHLSPCMHWWGKNKVSQCGKKLPGGSYCKAMPVLVIVYCSPWLEMWLIHQQTILFMWNQWILFRWKFTATNRGKAQVISLWHQIKNMCNAPTKVLLQSFQALTAFFGFCENKAYLKHSRMTIKATFICLHLNCLLARGQRGEGISHVNFLLLEACATWQEEDN